MSPTVRRALPLTAAVVALAAVLAFGPRMDGPRVIDGVTFTTKTGSPGLTTLGWAMLVGLPLLAYAAVTLALWWLLPRRRDGTD